jgi:hypothetical protein
MAAAAAMLAVSSAQAQTDASSVLSYDQAFFAESRPSTAYDMIGRLPGFSFTDVGNARGFAGTAGNVLINGQRPTAKSDSLQSILKRIDAADVERIDLIRGGAPGIDMQGLTVVANVILKREDTTRYVAQAEELAFIDGHMIPYGSFQFTREVGDSTYEGTISSMQNYDDSVGHGHHFVFDRLGNLVTADQAISHGLGIGLSAKGSATVPLWGGKFTANFTFQDSPFVDDLIYSRPGFRQRFADDSRDNIDELGLHWKGPLGGTELEALILQRLDHNNSSSSSDDGTTRQDFQSISDTGETIARATLRYLPLPELTLETGGEGAFNFLGGNTAFFVNGVDQPLPSAHAHVEEQRGELFAQGTWKFATDWMLEAGARTEYSTIIESGSENLTRSFFYLKPRAVLTWSADSDTQIRLRYEKVLGQLDFNNFIASANLSSTGVTVGNKDLRPDQHSQYEISVERHFWQKGAFVLTFMHEDIKDVVDFVPITDAMGNVFDAPGNIGNGQDNQISVQATLPLDRFFIPNGLLVTTGTFNLTSVVDPVNGMNRVISAQRPQTLNVDFTQDIDSLSSTWGISYYNCWNENSFRLTQVRDRKVLPPYFNIFWDYKPSAAWTFHLGVNDISGFLYKDKRFNYAGPRNTAPLDNIDEYTTIGIPQIDFRLRHSF